MKSTLQFYTVNYFNTLYFRKIHDVIYKNIKRRIVVFDHLWALARWLSVVLACTYATLRTLAHFCRNSGFALENLLTPISLTNPLALAAQVHCERQRPPLRDTSPLALCYTLIEYISYKSFFYDATWTILFK